MNIVSRFIVTALLVLSLSIPGYSADYSRVSVTATAGQTSFIVAFADGLIDQGTAQDTVEIYVNDILNTSASITWTSPTTVELAGYTPEAGDVIQFRRITEKDSLYVDFTAGTKIRTTTLDLNLRQLLHATHEALDVTVDTEDINDSVAAAAASEAAAAASAASINYHTVDTLADLLAYTGPATTVYVAGRASAGDGGQGVFVKKTGDFTAQVTADTLSGVYAPSNADPTGAVECWVRSDTGYYTPYMFGATGTGLTDDTAALNGMYTMAKYETNKWDRKSIRLLSGKYLLTSGLTWDGSIDITGDSSEKTVFLKNGNFVGITINGDQCKIGGFQMYSPTGAIVSGDTSDGIYITSAHLCYLYDIHVEFQGGNGVTVKSFTSGQTGRILTRFNGGTGLDIDSTGGAANTNASIWGCVDSLGNGDHGVHLHSGDNDYSVYNLLICQQNGKHGLFLEGIANKINFYGESNDQDDSGTGTGTYKDLYSSPSSVRNQVTILSATSNDAIVFDNVTDQEFNFGTANFISVPQVRHRQAPDSTDGKSLSLAAGQGGDGSGNPGGDLNIISGDGGGTNANAGAVYIRTGIPTGTGSKNAVYIQNDGGQTLIGGGFYPGFFTTAERDAATASGELGYGAIINNSTTGKLQRYNSTAWVDLDPSP